MSRRDQQLYQKPNDNSQELRGTNGCISSMQTIKMKASDCHPVLLPDVLHDQETSDKLHSSSDGGEKSAATDVVLEYFTPATRSTTESEILNSSADSDGFYLTQTCRREGVRVGDRNLYLLPPFIQIAEGDCSNSANLKRHRAASASPQQRLQRRQQLQSERRQQCCMATAPTPALLLGKPVGRTECAVNRRGAFAEDVQRIHCNKAAHAAQSQKQIKREDAVLSVRPAEPVSGTSHEANADTLRSWHYPAYTVWSAKAPTANGYILKAYGRSDTSQSQALQQLHRKTQPVPRRYLPVSIPASSAQVAAVSSPAWAPTSRYQRGVPLRILPRAVVVTRGGGAILQPTSTVAETKKLSKGTKADVERMKAPRRTTPQRSDCGRDTLLNPPSVLQGTEVTPRRERDARRLPKETGVNEHHTTGEESHFSALPFCTRDPDASAFSGNIHDVKDAEQRSTSTPTNILQPPTQKQHTSSAGACSIVSLRPASNLHHQCGEHSAIASKRTLINIAASASDFQGRSRAKPVSAAASNLLSTSQCASRISSEEAKRTRQCDVSLHSNKTAICPEYQYWEELAERLRQPITTRMTTCSAALTAFVDSSKLHQGCSVSVQPAKANLWAGFFWKSSPHIRLSSSSAGSESCSTQCPSPRGGTTAAPLSCAAAASKSSPSAPSSNSPSQSPGGEQVGPPATLKGPAFLPCTAGPSSLSVPTDRRQQQHALQQPYWPFSYYYHAIGKRQSQGVSAQIWQHQSEVVSKKKGQQQPQLSGCCYDQTKPSGRSPLEVLAKQAFAAPSWLHMYEATRLEVIGVPRGGGATRLLKSAEILLCKTATGAPCAAFGARVKEDRNSRQLIFLLPSREVVPVNHLKLLSCISQGSFGTVFRAHWEGKTVAVKQAHGSMTLEAMRSVVREINSFRSLDHPLILKYLGVCLDPNFLGIITEYLPGKSIFEALWESKILLTSAKRLKLCRQLVEAVNYMHTEKRLVHRDLKTSNLILNGDDGLKLCDFGKTRPLAFHGRLRLEDNGGSPRYMAPECFVVGNFIDEKVDVWGLGCCLMEIMGGPIPFENIHSNEGVIQAVTHKQMSPTVPAWFHPSMRALLQGCFALNPEKRPSAQQILEVLHLLSPEDVDRYDMTARRSP